MFALVDCNNFYVSCEQVFRPDLRGKPVVVLSNNDGCVISRSNEAKALGISMGAPAFEYKTLFDRHGIAVFSSNYALYGDMSARVMHMLSCSAPETEIYSIDEAFLQFTHEEAWPFHTYGLELKENIKRATGIPVSIGFAPTKALSKAANKIAKQFAERTKGVHLIDSEQKRIRALKWLRVEDVWGIGRRHALRLKRMGVDTAFRFTQLPDKWVRKHLSVTGLRLKMELQGIPTQGLETAKAKKHIATTRSFDRDYTEYEQIRERVATFAVSCAEKLRRQGSCCNALMVFLHTNGFRKDLPQYSRNTFIPLPFPSNSAMEIASFAVRGLQHIFRQGYRYKKAGVIAMDITPENHRQLSLFENTDPRHRQLMAAVDAANLSIGQQKIRLGCQDMGRIWKMRQERRSPRYTTRIDEIIKIQS